MQQGLFNTWVALLLCCTTACIVIVTADKDTGTDHSQHHDHGENTQEGQGEGEKEFAGDHHGWSYNILPEKYGMEKWNELYPNQCGAAMKKQSPIDIKKNDCKFSEELDAFDIIMPSEEAGGKKTNSTGMSLFSNGHTVQVNIEKEIMVMGGALGSQYKVAQLHFHWGKGGQVGSEHRIDGNMFMLEMHIVTFDSERFSNLGEAVGQEYGIAVLGILFKKGKHNSNLDNVVNNLQKLVNMPIKEQMPIEWFDVRNVLPAKKDHYYRYAGSLTTPMCAETVKWTVFAEHPDICPHQMMQFYNMTEGFYKDGSPVHLVNNWRAPQPLHGRSVYSSFSTREKLVEYTVDTTGDGGADNAAASMVFSQLLGLCMLCLLLRVL